MNCAEIFTKLQTTFRSRRTRTLAWRVEQLKGLNRFLIEQKQEILKALWQDLRKGEFEAEVTEIETTRAEIDYTLKNLAEWMEPVSVSSPLIDQPASSEIRSEPYGVVLILSAWNYPVNLLLAPLVGAIAGGNAVVLKPSEISANVSEHMAKWLPQYLDSEAIAVYQGGISETDALLDCAFDYIFFTGSGTVGKIVMAKAAKNLIPVTLELGGKSPAIVWHDTTIKTAARRIAWGKFLNAGQTCIAPDYIFVHKSIEEKFLAELKFWILEFYGTEPQKSPDYCRIVNTKNFLRLEKFLDNGELYCGGGKDANDRYIEPTVLRIKKVDVPVMQEEIFGPILPVIAVNELSEAMDFINAQPKPLALYLFTKSKNICEQVIEGTSSGGVCINDVVMHMPSPELPFGGVGGSGMGQYHGKRSFETFTHQKAVMKKQLGRIFLFVMLRILLANLTG